MLRAVLEKVKVNFFGNERRCLNTLFYLILALIIGPLFYEVYSEAVPHLCRSNYNSSFETCDIAAFPSIFFGLLYSKIVESSSGSFAQAIMFSTYEWVRRRISYYYREYEDDNVLGWNILVEDKVTGKFKLEMPTEDTFSLNEMMLDAEVLLDKVKAAAADMPPETSRYPNFIIYLDNTDDQIEFMRRVKNRVSQSIKGSLWPKYAMSRLKKKDRDVNPWVLPVQEKDEGMRARTMRTWLVFPSVLQTILRYSEDELKDSSENGKFIVSAETHRIRLLNLRKWAVAEFEGNLDKRYLSAEIILPTL